MKRLHILFAIAACLTATSAHAATMNSNPLGLERKTPVAQARLNTVELRLGAGSIGSYFGEGSGPVLSAVLERQVNEDLSLGVELSRSSTKFSSFDVLGEEWGYKYNHLTIAGRAAYHVHDLIDDDRVDVYGGGSMGLNTITLSSFGPSLDRPLAKSSYLVGGAFTGGRFWFRPNMAVSAEAGYHFAMVDQSGYSGFSWGSGSLGLAIRF